MIGSTSKLASKRRSGLAKRLLAGAASLMMVACAQGGANKEAPPAAIQGDVSVTPEMWPTLNVAPLDPAVEAQIDEIMAKMTLEQKVGQVIQADSGSVTPEDVKKYRLGSVLSGGNSAPGGQPYADWQTWLAAADAYWLASVDPEGVEIAIPIIWGIDAVHGHANLFGAIVFPHNIGLGAANNPDLIEAIMRVTATELIISGHDWTFAPTLAVPRDDRWGRTYEGFSEDPSIVASYSDRIVFGLQGRPGAEGFLGDGKVISSAKHFLADGGTRDGRDQGDAIISERELIDIHGIGYFPAIEAGVQTIMASFSSWNGVKITGSKALLTDILKDRLGFTGFVVGDWNAHGQVPGCTNTDCPQAFIAGIDMFMAPDSWKGLYESTLQHVKSGRIPMERLDDAVRRILRVKIQSGVFEKGLPSSRPGAGDPSLLATAEGRAIARQAVRESLVLLKNDGGVLPLDGGLTVLVVGDGADSITKAAGGWTLSWQGGGYPNETFPNGESILSGIRAAVTAEGGTVIFDADGETDAKADVVIAVYGENPYAEFQGDRTDVDFEPNEFDTALLESYRAKGMPVVSVFLSGRPLWTNPEINDSDAFVAAWLPGTEGGGVADILFQTEAGFDFKGRLPFSWPRSAVQTDNNRESPNYDPQFAFGYGLSYAGEAATVGELSEESGLSEEARAAKGVLFRRGAPTGVWQARIVDSTTSVLLSSGTGTVEALSAGRSDHKAQEDGLALTFSGDGAALLFDTQGTGEDWSRESNSMMELVFAARSDGSGPATVGVSVGCGQATGCARLAEVDVAPGDWQDYRVTVSCFADAGVDMTTIRAAALFTAGAGTKISIADVRLSEDTNGAQDCGDQ